MKVEQWKGGKVEQFILEYHLKHTLPPFHFFTVSPFRNSAFLSGF